MWDLIAGWCLFSSLSQWVHACDALELPHQQREQLDAFIDQLYKNIDKGHFSFKYNEYRHVHIYTHRCAVNVQGSKHWLHVVRILHLKCIYWSSEMWRRFDGWKVFHRLSFLLACLTETGDFLNCEGSGLFLLQSSCENNAECFSSFCLFTLHKCYCVGKCKDVERSLPVMCFCRQGNHSCIPNAEASFPDNNFLLHLSALSDISPGEVRGGCGLTWDMCGVRNRAL